MKKKNLAILLIIPFLVALFGIVTIKTAFNIIENDVVRILWNYRDNELFEVGHNDIKLEATGEVADSRYKPSDGNQLVWTVENIDGAKEDHASIDERQGQWFLTTKSVGKVRITCTTEKGNVTPLSMTGIIYSGSAFVINTKVDGSGQSIDSILYYGQYDLNQTTHAKQNATIEFDVTVSSDDILNGLAVDKVETSSNLDVNLEDGIISVNGVGNGMSQVVLKNDLQGISTTFEFKVVAGGVNVYTYDDLLYCTNRSENGEIAVLRKNFESRAIAEGSTATNVTMFGNYNSNGFNFADEVYRFDTTYNHEYIDQWNEFVKTHSEYKPTGMEIIAGLRVQKDIYGNGYTINLHNLCYPSKYTDVPQSNGESIRYATLGEGDLFRGPKPFYLLGDPNSIAPLVTAFGQDNIGLYVDGNNITLNDVKVKNCDFGVVMQNLTYAGTVVEVHGNNNTIKNSVLQNGKNVLRSFSSKELTVDNSILSSARNFLFTVGSNNYVKNNPETDTRKFDFTLLDGTTYSSTLADYLAPTDTGTVLGDQILSLFNTGYATFDDIMSSLGDGSGDQITYTKDQMHKSLQSVQKGLNRDYATELTNLDGSTQIVDTIFYRSGIASIGVESLFNGPFLYNNSPSMINAILGLMGSMLDVAIPMFPTNISGTSYPVSVSISGNTQFFDYKALSEWDISGLIDQNISNVVAGLNLDRDFDITIDDIFPLKSILTTVARNNRLIYSNDGTEYINIPVAYYGGGLNLSTVTIDQQAASGLTANFNVDLLDSYLNMTTKLDLSGLANGGGLADVLNDEFVRYMKEVLTKTVTTVTGFEAFKFQFVSSPSGLVDANGMPIAPNYRDLIN